MGMEFGRIRNKHIEDRTGWIRRKDLEYIYGWENNAIKASLKRISGRVMDKFTILRARSKRYCIREAGKKALKMRDSYRIRRLYQVFCIL